METKMENETETGIAWWLIGVILVLGCMVCGNVGSGRRYAWLQIQRDEHKAEGLVFGSFQASGTPFWRVCRTNVQVAWGVRSILVAARFSVP